MLTDTNQHQASTWGSINDNVGYVEQANENPPKAEPSEVSLPAVPGAGSATQTVTTLTSVKSIRASAYGNPITNTPEDQAFNAFDGNPDTRWAEGAFSPATGARLTVKLVKPVTASHVTLLQPQTGTPQPPDHPGDALLRPRATGHRDPLDRVPAPCPARSSPSRPTRSPPSPSASTPPARGTAPSTTATRASGSPT